MAHIVKRKTTRGTEAKPIFSYYVVYREDGREQWKHAGYKLAEANTMKNDIERNQLLGIPVSLKDITLADLSEKWLKEREGRVRPKVLASYRPHVKRLTDRFGKRKVKTIRPEEISEFAVALNAELAPATAGRCLTITKNIFETAIEWGYLGRNPARYVRKPKACKADLDYLEPAELQKLITSTEERHRCLIMCACLTGCRQSEILGLAWDNVDLAGGRIYIRQVLQGNRFFPPKTETSKRTVEVPAILVDELKQHQARQAIELEQNPHNLVFTNPAGMHMQGKTVTQQILYPALKRAELRRVGFHSLRHTYASMLISQGESIKTVQALLGHSNASMTLNVYGHLFEGQTKSAVARLEAAFTADSHGSSKQPVEPAKNPTMLLEG